MKTYKALKEIALDILEKYKNVGETVIYEYSGSIGEDLAKHEWECDVFRMQIEELAESKWTPVTERNPEEYDAYFITYESESWGGPKLPLITKIGTYNPYNRACPWLEDTGGVIAWMSLPEPYHPKEGQK